MDQNTQYATVAEFKRWLTDKTSYVEDADGNNIDALLTDCLLAASRGIDDDTGRIFYRVELEVRQVFVERCGEVSFVDLIADTVPTIVIDTNGDDVPDKTLATTDYLLLPRTGKNGAAAVRYTDMRLRSTASVVLTPGYMVQITGDWGYLDDGVAPSKIKQACLLKAARLLARRDAKLGSIIMAMGSSTVEVVAKLDRDYADLVDAFKVDVYGVD